MLPKWSVRLDWGLSSQYHVPCWRRAELAGEYEGQGADEDELDADGAVSDRSSSDQSPVAQRRGSGVCRRPSLPRHCTRQQTGRHKVASAIDLQ